MELTHDGDPLLAALLRHDEERTERSAYELLGGAGRVWRGAVDPGEPGSARATAAAASAVMLKRALHNGRLAIPHSTDHAPPEDRLVPKRLWLRDRGRLVRSLGVPDTASAFLRRIGAQLEAGLEGLNEAVRSGELVLKDGRLVTPRTLADAEPPVIAETRRALFDRFGDAQLPDVLVEVDAATRFSWVLLGRPPRTEGELVTLYAALIALGSDLSPTAVCRMVSGVEPKPVGVMVRRLTADADLRAGSDEVCGWLRSHPISAGWGDGAFASSDSMSLEASRHLWSTRADPRRRAFAVGSYTHLADWWGVLYDQPVVLNARQVGPAIEGALRQEAAPELSKLAVDTHGHTHFGMALAKLVGLDLCPRLKDLPSRPLYLPKGTTVPDSLADICSPSVSPRTVQAGWDGLLRLAVSVRDGYCPATYAMERYGSASRGERTYEAGAAIGKLLGTVYHADHLTSPDFRREVGRSLARGEAVHTLQRAIHAGPIGPKAGRSQDELAALSNALTLLTNVVMAWNTSRMQRAVAADPAAFTGEHLRRVAPIAHAHVNMRGVMRFQLGEHRDALLGEVAGPTAGRATG